MPKMPLWKLPKDLANELEEGDGCWEDERWSPILLTVMSDTKFEGREIPLSWQIEFEPWEDELARANDRLEEMEIDPDGYGWAKYIQKTIQKTNPGLAKRLHTTDSEIDTCVIWVETEEDCRELLETTWNLIFKKPGPSKPE